MAGTRRIADLRAEHARVVQHLAGPQTPVHMLGIGGVGMAGVAVQLAARGYAVSGCDGAREGLGPWLGQRGIPVAHGHHPDHLTPDTGWLVHSPAVSAQEPEVRAARARGLPIFLRGTVLPALLDGQLSMAVGGAHGKTTTSAMLAHVLRKAGHDVSFCIGGEVPTLGGVAHAGRAGLMVVEADESDGTLALYAADYAVITNVELDHVDYFATEAELDACFASFAGQAKRAVVYCADDAGAVRAAGHAKVRTLGYGLAQGEWRADILSSGARSISARIALRGVPQGELQLEVPGRTNLLDALAALAVAVDMGLSFDVVAEGLRTFRPVRRRFDVLAERNGILVISDYAHHPTEIAAFLAQVRGLNPQRILAVYQAHRYSRTAALGAAFPPAFAGVDELILTPVYAASEEPVPGGGLADLHGHFVRAGKIPVVAVQSLLEAWTLIRKKWRAGDVVAVIGAGDVEKIAAWAAAALLEESRESSL